jgi:hypothetical protein
MARETVMALIEMKAKLPQARAELGLIPVKGNRIDGHIEHALALVDSMLAQGR